MPSQSVMWTTDHHKRTIIVLQALQQKGFPLSTRFRDDRVAIIDDHRGLGAGVFPQAGEKTSGMGGGENHSARQRPEGPRGSRATRVTIPDDQHCAELKRVRCERVLL
jgi:hypothetical protein